MKLRSGKIYSIPTTNKSPSQYITSFLTKDFVSLIQFKSYLEDIEIDSAQHFHDVLATIFTLNKRFDGHTIKQTQCVACLYYVLNNFNHLVFTSNGFLSGYSMFFNTAKGKAIEFERQLKKDEQWFNEPQRKLRHFAILLIHEYWNLYDTFMEI